MSKCKVLWILGSLISFLSATPNGFLRVSEEVWASGKEGALLMRFEKLNRGSYYDWEETTYLDEYRYGEDGRELVKSTLLTSFSCFFPEADTRQPLERKLLKNDGTLKVGELLAKYPLNRAAPWSSKRVAEFEISADKGIVWGGLLTVVPSDELKKIQEVSETKFFKIQKVQVGNAGGLFLELVVDDQELSDESSWQNRVIRLSSDLRRQMYNLSQREDFYLSFGEYQTLKEARDFANELTKMSREKDVFSLNLEIWLRKVKDVSSYSVVASDSERAIRKKFDTDWRLSLGLETTRVEGAELWNRFNLWE